MPTDWVTSRWLRSHDWDWHNDMPDGLAAMGKQRARLVPRKFFYHPCRMVRPKGGELGGETGEIEYVAHDDVVALLLRAFDQPQPLDMWSRGAAGRDAHVTATVDRRIRDLQETGLLVPDGEQEEVDCPAVFWAAKFLFSLMQLEEEFVAALEMVVGIEPQRVVEIGTCHGGSLFSWAQAAHADARLVSIDLPGGEGGGGYTAEYARRYQQFCAPDQSLTCILADSTADTTARRVTAALDGEPIDFLFIDGDHSYEGASRDFELYAPMVRPGGLVMFHDIQHSADPDGYGVRRLWHELREKHDSAEFIGSQGVSLGIGMLTL